MQNLVEVACKKLNLRYSNISSFIELTPHPLSFPSVDESAKWLDEKSSYFSP